MELQRLLLLNKLNRHVKRHRPRRPLHRRHILSAVTAALVALCGCSSGEAEAAPVTSRPATTVTIAPTENFANPAASPTTEAAPPDAEIERSPIDRLLGFETDPERLSEAHRETRTAYAESLTACMAEAGFDGYRALVEPSPSPEDLLARTPSANVAQYGYGPTIVLRSRSEAQFGETPDEVPPDAGYDYLQDNPHIGEELFFTNLIKCEEQGREQHPLPDPSFPDQLAAEIFELRDQAQQGPRVQEAWDEWSGCMAAEGYDVADRQAARITIEEQGLPLIELLNRLAAENRQPTDQERDQFTAGLAELAVDEETMVAADLACAAESDVETITTAAVYAAEEAWIEDNGDRVAMVLAEQ